MIIHCRVKMRMRNFTIEPWIEAHDVDEALAASTAVSNSRTRFVGCREVNYFTDVLSCSTAV